jgi:CPA2 family monovalent cation:H+ antiporter-2
MEISLPRLTASWRIPVLGTLAQLAASVCFALLLGTGLGWPWQRAVLIGFVISLSSTAVVLKLLDTWRESDSPTGRDVIGILLAQDILIVPMLIIVGLLSGGRPAAREVTLQVLGGVGVLALLVWINRAGTVHLPLGRWLENDRELQVFAAFGTCFGLALATGLLGLSAALGAFVAGILVAAANETHWVHEALFPLHVLLVAAFFVSVGMLIDLDLLRAHGTTVALLVLAVLVTNTVINTVVLRVAGRSWQNSWYGGALLSQIGEFSFVLAAVGRESGLIVRFGYELTVAVIAVSLLISPFWIAGIKRITHGGAGAARR